MNSRCLTSAQARKLLSGILAKGKVVFLKHALEELAKDDMNEGTALHVLKRGRIYEPGEPKKDAWRYRVHGADACVVIEFDSDALVIVVTAWRKQ